ncbi:hypothetical protein BKA65DRAFT_530390 [Rhexocercosporidium sp. MPI-PUGE-AT-0058]|nr:hypothetical protein BKA65DRAFT_530390 [Rhexocercosporidium sp. MPI-PUGE-AT-0058]
MESSGYSRTYNNHYNTPEKKRGFNPVPKQNICDNTLDDADLATHYPLDNGRHASPPVYPTVGKLDKLPVEILTQILMYTDIPSITRFHRVNSRAMLLVDSVPQYATILKHCPNIIRATLSIQADGFDCNVLYAALSSTRCAMCESFDGHLYLIDCRRLCYLCFTRRPEYMPLTIGLASTFFLPDTTKQRHAITSRQCLRAANPPSILSLPGRYCTAWSEKGGNLVRKRLELFDRRAVIQNLAAPGPPMLDKTTRDPYQFMAIITAPHLFNSSLQVDWGYFCLGYNDEMEERKRHFRMNYTRNEVLEHVVKYGPVEETSRIPGRFMHVARARQ